jgi:chaperonin GroES
MENLEMSLDKLMKLLENDNIAEALSEEKLLKIGQQVSTDYKIDKDSRREWETTVKKAMDLANQVCEIKTFPWEGAANIKYPLLSNAAISFASRISPSIVRENKVVEGQVIGKDPQGLKEQRSHRVSEHMSYQLLVKEENWKKDTDHLLHTLPIVGTVYRKVYYSPTTKAPCSELCDYDRVVVNDNIKSLQSARRITHDVYLYKNEIIERIRAGLFLDIEDQLDRTQTLFDENSKNAQNDEDPQYHIYEQHRFWDLDEDGYAEPYIVLTLAHNDKVLGIYKRFDENKIEVNKHGKIIYIEPDLYFIDYHFIPSFNGKFHSIGFGTLLLPLNEAINTLFNQLIDSGTLANLQSGIVSLGGLGAKDPSFRLNMGEFKNIKLNPGADMHSSVMLLPTKEPSQTLFQLLGMLIEAGNSLAAINDILTGDQQAQNAPATSTLALIEQGLRVYSSIKQRFFDSLKREFKRIFALNHEYLDPIEYYQVLDDEKAISNEDYDTSNVDVVPVADPNISSDAQRYAKTNALLQLQQFPALAAQLNPQALLQRYLEDLNIAAPESLIAPPAPPQPSPDMLKVQMQQQKMQMEHEYKTQKMEMDKELKGADLALKATKLDQEQKQTELKKEEMDMKGHELASKIEKMKADAIKDKAVAATQDQNAQANLVKAQAALIQAKKPKGESN